MISLTVSFCVVIFLTRCLRRDLGLKLNQFLRLFLHTRKQDFIHEFFFRIDTKEDKNVVQSRSVAHLLKFKIPN